MHSLLVPTLLWGYWANIVYIIGMIGYLTIDTISYAYISLNNTISSIIYIFLAIIFIIDAVLYTIDWHMYAVKLRKNQTEPIQYRSEFVACIFQNFGSFFYLIGALLNFDRIRLIKKILFFNFIGIISFLIESFFTLFGWIIIYRRKSSNAKNTYIWAHILNITASLIYLCSIILAYYFYTIYKIVNSNTVLIIQIFGDFVYLLDAYLYHECWQRDKEEFHFNTEQTNFYIRPH
jgi:hypothetical protein